MEKFGLNGYNFGEIFLWCFIIIIVVGFVVMYFCVFCIVFKFLIVIFVDDDLIYENMFVCIVLVVFYLMIVKLL